MYLLWFPRHCPIMQPNGERLPPRDVRAPLGEREHHPAPPDASQAGRGGGGGGQEEARRTTGKGAEKEKLYHFLMRLVEFWMAGIYMICLPDWMLVEDKKNVKK